MNDVIVLSGNTWVRENRPIKMQQNCPMKVVRGVFWVSLASPILSKIYQEFCSINWITQVSNKQYYQLTGSFSLQINANAVTFSDTLRDLNVTFIDYGHVYNICTKNMLKETDNFKCIHRKRMTF